MDYLVSQVNESNIVKKNNSMNSINMAAISLN